MSSAKTTEWIVVKGKQRTFPQVGDRVELTDIEGDYGRCKSPQGDAQILSAICRDGSAAQDYAKLPGEYSVERVEPMADISGLTPDPDAPDCWIIHIS